MRFRNFGTLSRKIPVVGQGTWQIAEHGAAAQQVKDALRAGIELGMTHIDTAEMYGSGRAEEIVGEAIKGLPRERLFIVSKVLPSNATFKGTIKSCEASLRRLQTDYLDCYLLHWRGNQPLSDTMSALEHLVSAGKIKSLGVSNFDVEDLKEAEASLTREKIVCNQVLYNPYARGIERKLIPYCQQHDIAVVAYTPFGQKKPPAPTSKAGAALGAIAEKHHATIHQVMLAFLVRLDGLFTIPKASSNDHIRENAEAGDLILDQQDIDSIGEAFPAPGRDVPLEMV